MKYEITQDCRIANQDYEKGQIVSKEEVGGVFFSVMKELDQEAIPAEKTVKKASKKEKKAESEDANPVKQEDPTPEGEVSADQTS